MSNLTEEELGTLINYFKILHKIKLSIDNTENSTSE